MIIILELAKCKHHKAVGYGYTKFYEIEDLHHLRNETDVLHLRIAILAARDAHIMLSATAHPGLFEPLYELVLGAGSNTFCEIRRRLKLTSLKTKRVVNVLSAVDPVAVLIRITKSGLIEVRNEDNEDIISGTDPDLLPIRFISFCSWGLTEAKFFYDCPNSLCRTL